MTDHTNDGPNRASASVDALARRAIDLVRTLCRRGNRLGAGVLIITVLICGISFSLGVAALSGGMRNVWIALGGFFGLLAVYAVVRAMLSLAVVARSSEALIEEVRSLLSGNPDNERVVIETIAVSEASQDESVVVMSRQFHDMQGRLGPQAGRYPGITAAMGHIARYPAYLFAAAMIDLVFAVLGLLFLIGLMI